MTVTRSNSNYAAHKRWRQKNQRLGLTADGKVRVPRVRMSPEMQRASNTLRMKLRRALNIKVGLKWNGQRRVKPLLLAVFFERLALAIARVMVFLPPESVQEFTVLGRQMALIRRKHGHRKVRTAI